MRTAERVSETRRTRSNRVLISDTDVIGEAHIKKRHQRVPVVTGAHVLLRFNINIYHFFTGPVKPTHSFTLFGPVEGIDLKVRTLARPLLIQSKSCLEIWIKNNSILFSHYYLHTRLMSTLKRKADATAGANDPKKPKKDASLTSFFGPPKTVISSTNGNSTSKPPESVGKPISFDKEKWVSTLSAEQKDLLKLEIDTLDPSWLAHLKTELVTPGFLSLKRFLKREIDTGKKIFPPLEEVYSW